MRHKIVLLDNTTNKKLALGLPNDNIVQDITITFPEKDGTVVLKEDFVTLLEETSNSSDIKGYTGSQGLQGYTGSIGSQGLQGITGYTGSVGYTGSKGDPGAGLSISKIFNSVSELLVDTITEETFGLVAGTLPQSDPDYGKLYFRKNNTWTYITDLSIEGAAGIQGPQGIQGPIGYTGSQGIQGPQGIQGVGYTGSAGTNGIISTSTPSGGVDGDTWFQY